MDKGFSVYFHIPFCHAKCPYCDFNTYALATIPEKAYTEAICSEIDFRASKPEWQNRKVNTIYFGGGTPSIFRPSSIKLIIQTLKNNFDIVENCENTLEVNPGNVSTDNLSELIDASINRLSFGSQSFQISVLKTLGRNHTPEQILSAVNSAKIVGFNNISLDLIYGVPGQTIHDTALDAIACLELEVSHISTYSLTIEKGTPFYQSKARGLITLPQDEIVLEMHSKIEEILKTQNIYRYEISNFANPGFESMHNMAYWNGDDYLGIGAGAHSFLKTNNSINEPTAKRWSSYALPQKFIDSATSLGCAESWSESLTKKELYFEQFFLGLRKIDGISLENIFYIEQSKTEKIIDTLCRENLLIKEGSMIRLSQRGLEIADSVISQFSIF